MAILIKKNNKNVFVSGTGVITNAEKQQAENLNSELKKSISYLETGFIRKGLLTEEGVKKDALQIWYEIGNVLNEKIDKYKIRGSVDEPYFWQSIYDYISKKIQKNPPPKRSSEWKRNHFRLCAKMAERQWSEVKTVGPWSIWRDVFDNAKLLEDDRVFDWVIKAINKSKLGHKELRPFIHATRRQLNKTDTSVLTTEELYKKLDDVKIWHFDQFVKKDV